MISFYVSLLSLVWIHVPVFLPLFIVCLYVLVEKVMILVTVTSLFLLLLEVTERDANQPAVMLGSGLTRPATPLPPPRNLASGEQVTVSGPEQSKELYTCSDTLNTPEGTDGRGDDDTETPRVSYRGTSEYKSSGIAKNCVDFVQQHQILASFTTSLWALA